jgi:hypothetical protein
MDIRGRLASAILSTLTGCSSMAVWTAPEKTPQPDHSLEAQGANDAFWDAFHHGRYHDIGPVIDRLEAVYLANPRDPQTTAHIGFAHAWRLVERARLDVVPPSITDDAVLGRKYFAEAVRLSPKDARFLGFLGGLELAEASIHGDEKLTRRGYYDLVDARDAWPEFNLFTISYSLSRLPHTDPRYAEAIDDQWKNLDVCADEKVDRKTGDFSKYMSRETTEGPKRACYNSWIAPHNFEGFFLNMGDMLVKNGEPLTARSVYAQAKLSKTYDAWPYKSVLEDRMAAAEHNVEIFRHPKDGERIATPMVFSTFACMGCHQE